MPAGPAAPLELVKSDTGFHLAIVVFDASADFRQADQDGGVVSAGRLDVKWPVDWATPVGHTHRLAAVGSGGVALCEMDVHQIESAADFAGEAVRVSRFELVGEVELRKLSCFLVVKTADLPAQ